MFNLFSSQREYLDIAKQLTKKNNATNKYVSVDKPFHFVSANAALPIPRGSYNPITTTSVVSLYRPIKVLTIPGIDIFKACGSVINLVFCQ